jgi:lipopolysaccharide export system permease protein
VTLFLYVLRLLSAAVVVSASGLCFIALPGIVVGAVHRLGGVEVGALMGFLPLALVDLVPYMLPIGFLLALVSTYGRLAADNEWTAINMAGIHPARMMLPAALVGLLLAAVSHYLVTEVSPGNSFRQKEYARSVLVEGFRDVSKGRTEIDYFKDFYLSAQSRDPGTNVFRNVTIHLPPKPQDKSARKEQKDTGGKESGGRAPETGITVLADVAEFSFRGNVMRIDLTRPRNADASNDRQVGFVVFEIDIDDLLKVKPKNRAEWRFQTSRDLRRMLREGRVEAEDVRRATYELHRRDSMTGTYLLFLLLGVPTGLLLRRGTQLGALAAAVAYALLYYLLSIRLGKSLANWGTIPPALGAWATVSLGSAAGLWLCFKAFRR